jgi:tetratricopeptide (TPR) repeat protein
LLVSVLTALTATSSGAVEPWSKEYPLDAVVRGQLAGIQQDWSEWLAAFEVDDPASEEEALERILEAARDLGMQALPELSLGASARGVEFARLGDRRRGQRALAAAEQLDPRRPETHFARATIHRLDGEWWSFVAETARGHLSLLRLPLERRVWLHNLLLWSLTTLLLAGCAFVAVLMLVRGPALFGSLLKVIRRYVPVPVGIGAILLLLLYCQRSERWVLAALFLLFGLAPILLDEQRRRITAELSPMARAAESARLGELRGTLFNDLQRLTVALPDSVAVSHLLADQDRRLGQCGRAKALYQRVVAAEPRNAAAWVDLGSCHFLDGEYDEAIEFYRRGVAIDQQLAEGHFNLSLAYSEFYRFAESERALGRAQRINSTLVAEWLARSPRRGAADVGSGLRRASEIRRDLQASWVLEADSAAWSSPWRDYLSLPMAVAGLILAVLVGRVLPRAHLEAMAPPMIEWGSRWSTLYRVLLPGLPELEAGDSMRSLIAIATASGLLLLPWVGTFGYRLPWGFEPTVHISWLTMIVGLALFFTWRWRREVAY